ELRCHGGLCRTVAQEVWQMLLGVGKQYIEDETHRTGGALDVGKDGFDRHQQSSSRGNRPAISSPVNCATQPSGLLNSRIATKWGFSPMSNQCLVPAGTEIRSFFSQRTAY